MKKTIFTLAMIPMIVLSLMSSCNTPAEKEEAAQEKVVDAREDVLEAKDDLKEAQIDAVQAEQKNATAEEWKEFKRETDEMIQANRDRISELKANMKKSGQKMDAVYQANIDTLQARNNRLKDRINNYEKNQSDWASFKREFNRDMEEIGNSLKNLTVDNKK